MDNGSRTLAGRYELCEVIGRGGMGTVYCAVDLLLRRSVAVKLLPEAVGGQDPTSVARFEREARAAARLSHPAVVAVYDTGADEATRYIVMELISGRSLEAIVRDEGPLEPGRAAGIAARVADALAAAHAAGIVHRDIKPANVMVAQDGSVKVLDFGIARAMGGTTLTQTASVLGTAVYMSPEQALGQAADERSDIYSLGCVLYTLLAGHPPFTGDNAAAILHQHANVTAPRLRDETRRVSPELEALVMWMLAKTPDCRPQTAAQVRDGLTNQSTRPSTTPTAVTPTARQLSTAATLQLRAARPRRRRLLVAGALVGVVAAAVAVIALALGGSSSHPTGASRFTTTKKHPRVTITTTTAAAPTKPPITTARRPPKPRTVAQTAGALTALSTDDVQSRAIDQQAAQQMGNGLANVLNSYDMGNTANAEQQLTNLSQQVAMLEQQGHITSGAAPALKEAVAKLSTALARAPTLTPEGSPAHPTPPAAHPPGHGGQPPGHAKHHNKHGE
ncbi:MAG TPA: protein kinase [Solirubrobacteraceae bacterium]|nr:protein kinase [Solirubrobacteraceae bacterium]